ncbi:hypothetical protein ACCO45_009897 [Purpureocillium lilacinum]|uniref:Uncharacterized protein n=2 Tax=Purpureocillium lilacinum TaxID=33203 RepID=A0ACC4DIP3_PURLI
MVTGSEFGNKDVASSYIGVGKPYTSVVGMAGHERPLARGVRYMHYTATGLSACQTAPPMGHLYTAISKIGQKPRGEVLCRSTSLSNVLLSRPEGRRPAEQAIRQTRRPWAICWAPLLGDSFTVSR